jgi:hypothetical protein
MRSVITLVRKVMDAGSNGPEAGVLAGLTWLLDLLVAFSLGLMRARRSFRQQFAYNDLT